MYSARMPILDNAQADGAGRGVNVADFEDIVLQLFAKSSPTGTVKVQVSDSDTEPDWSSAASESNNWTYAQAKDYSDNSAKNGSVGFAWSGSAGGYHAVVNVERMRWVNLIISGYTGGAFYGSARGYSHP